MASTDAKPVPQKNVAYRVTFPIFDADGDLVTGASALDSEISKDGGTFADCTNEATEIATSSGMYYLDLTLTEMNADTVALIIKTSTSGAKTTPIVLYPEEAGDIRVNLTTIDSVAVAAQNLAKTTGAIVRGTATTGASTTSIPTSAFSPSGAATDQFKGKIITFDRDTTTTALRGQSTDITGSSNSATPTLTVTALTTAPASGDTFSIT
jgi:hypothetical protein